MPVKPVGRCLILLTTGVKLDASQLGGRHPRGGRFGNIITINDVKLV